MPVLSHMSAIEYMESHRFEVDPKRISLTSRALNNLSLENVLFELSWQNKEDPVDILFATNATRWRRSCHTCHQLPLHCPPTSFAQVGDEVVASPELCFLQMATELTFPQLVVLGLRLCGNYNAGDAFPFDSRTGALTTAAKLKMYLDKCDGAKGVSLARSAAKYVFDGSGSAAESKICALITLPRRRGGYGFTPPTLNGRVGNSGRIADFIWPKYGVAVEYDSRERHEGDRAYERDSIRRTEVTLKHYTVFSLTIQQYRDMHLFDGVMRAISWQLQYQIRPATKEVWQQRKALRKDLGLSY